MSKVEIINSHDHRVQLNELPPRKIGPGMSPTAFYIDEDGDVYLAKYPKLRDKKDILSPDNLPYYSDDLCSQYIKDNALGSAFRELIAASLASAIFQDFLIVPPHYLDIDEDGRPLILSKFIDFNEFLTKKEITKNKLLPRDWTSLPKRSDLHLSIEEAKVLGKLYIAALLLHHWDLVNNINLSNSGYQLDAAGNFIPAIVDWGNTLDQGFKGLTADENCEKNPEFTDDEYSSSSSDTDEISGYSHCVPFDKEVYTKLPRQIVSDLFEMDSDDEISMAVRLGANEALTKARKSLEEEQLDLQAIIDNCFTKLSTNAKTQCQDFKTAKILNRDMYFPDSEHRDKDTIVTIIHGRLKSLERIFKERVEGKPLEKSASEILEKYRKAQAYPRTFFANKSSTGTPATLELDHRITETPPALTK